MHIKKLVIAALATTGIWLSGCSDPPSGAQQTTDKPASQAKPSKSFQQTPEAFRQALNADISKFDKNLRMPEAHIEPGEVHDGFTHQFARNVGMIGTVNKSDGSLREVMFILVANKTTSAIEHLNAVSILFAAVHALAPSIPREQSTAITTEMVTHAMQNIQTGRPIEQQLGEIELTAAASQATGLMFSINPKPH